MSVHALIESPLGLENAYAIASHPDVHGISLGEAARATIAQLEGAGAGALAGGAFVERYGTAR